MRCGWLLVVIACSSGKNELPMDPCGTRLESHARWLKMLVEEGSPTFPPERDLQLVTLRGVTPSQQPLQPLLTIDRERVVFQGRYLGNHESSPPDPTEQLARLVGEHGVEEVSLVIDERAPWRTIAAVGRAAAIAKIRRLRFMFRGESALPKPPPSWIDRELEEVENADPDGPLPSLEPPVHPPSKRRLFDRCPSARELLARLDERAEKEQRDKGDLMAEGLPGALRACRCAEDVGAVERWMWSLWRRYEPNLPITSVVVGVDPQRTKLEIAADEPWSVAHRKLVAHANDPVAF